MTQTHTEGWGDVIVIAVDCKDAMVEVKPAYIPMTRAQLHELERRIHADTVKFFECLEHGRVGFDVAWMSGPSRSGNGVRVSWWSEIRGIVRAEGMGL